MGVATQWWCRLVIETCFAHARRGKRKRRPTIPAKSRHPRQGWVSPLSGAAAWWWVCAMPCRRSAARFMMRLSLTTGTSIGLRRRVSTTFSVIETCFARARRGKRKRRPTIPAKSRLPRQGWVSPLSGAAAWWWCRSAVLPLSGVGGHSAPPHPGWD